MSERSRPYHDASAPVQPRDADRLAALEREVDEHRRRLAALEGRGQTGPSAPPPRRPAPRSPARSKLPIRRLTVGEELHGRFVGELHLTGDYGEFLAIQLGVDGGALVTLSCAHKALHYAVRRARPAVGDHVHVVRLQDGTTKDGHTCALYDLKVAPAERDGVFDR